MTTESKIGSIIECANRHRQAFEAVRTPLDEHKAKVEDVKLRMRDNRGKFLLCKDQSTADEERLLDLAFECGREVERLDSKFEATRAEAEAQYTQATDDILEAFCVDWIGLFGLTLVKECLLHHPKAKSSSSLPQQQPTPERDFASREDSPHGLRDGSITVSLRKRKPVRRNMEQSSKRNKSATPQSHKLNGESTQSPQSTPSHADKQSHQSTRHTGGRSGGVAERRQCHLKSVVPGKIYLTFFKSWCLALLLPTENLQAVGVSETMATLGLTKDIPECYVYDSRTGKFSWTKECEDGGEHEHKRFYPVIYFDGAEFPARSSVGWVLVNNLEEYDVAARPRNLIEHHKQAELYLKQMKSMSQSRTTPPSRGTDVRSVPERVQDIEATNPEPLASCGTERVEGGYIASAPQLDSPRYEAGDAATTEQPVWNNHTILEPPSTSEDQISTSQNAAHEASQSLHSSSTDQSSSSKSYTADVEDEASTTQSSRVSDDISEVSAQTVPGREYAPSGFRNVPTQFSSTIAQPFDANQPTISNTAIHGRTQAFCGYDASKTATSIDSQLLERLQMPPGAGIPGWDGARLCLPSIQTAWDCDPMPNQPEPSPSTTPAPPTQPTRTAHTSSTPTSFRTFLPSGTGPNTMAAYTRNNTPMATPVTEWELPLPTRIVELLRPHTRGYEPKPDMFLHNGLYHCVLCPQGKRRLFASVRAFGNHFCKKHG